jgi:hypothetical protein
MMDPHDSSASSTLTGPAREQISNLERDLQPIIDKTALVEAGRVWAKDAHAKGVTFADVAPILEQSFGAGGETVSSHR